MNEAVINPFNFCIRFIKISILYLFPVVSAGFFVSFLWRGYSSPTRAPHRRHVPVLGSRQTHPLFYPVRQLNHSVLLAVVPVFGSRIARISSDPFRFDPKQSLVHPQAVHQPSPFIERINTTLSKIASAAETLLSSVSLPFNVEVTPSISYSQTVNCRKRQLFENFE